MAKVLENIDTCARVYGKYSPQYMHAMKELQTLIHKQESKKRNK